MTAKPAFTLDEIRAAHRTLQPHVLETPVVPWVGKVIDSLAGATTKVVCKLELMQFAGSFKVRAVLTVMMNMTKAQLANGVVAVSAGNHAIAVSYASSILGADAVVVMPKFVSQIRIDKCKSRGAKVVLVESLSDAFAKVKEIQISEKRELIHPFEGPFTALGNATLGVEFLDQVGGELDAVIVGVGGGGFLAGVACAVKEYNPKIEVYGVEPAGADALSRSLKAGSPQTLASVDTIADSLSPPYALPYSFSLCKQYVDDVVTVTDDEMCEAMAAVYYELKLAVEPGAAAACAGLFGPLRKRLEGKRVGVVLCGSSIDAAKFVTYMARGEERYRKVLLG